MIIISESRYLGKICEKHPEKKGERRRKNYLCVECMAEKRRSTRSLPMMQEELARQQRERRARAQTSDIKKTITLAKSLAKQQNVKDYTTLLVKACEILNYGGVIDAEPVRAWLEDQVILDAEGLEVI